MGMISVHLKLAVLTYSLNPRTDHGASLPKWLQQMQHRLTTLVRHFQDYLMMQLS